jgi:hypothetical protein
MSKKQITGVVIGVLGAILAIYALYNMKKIANAKGTITEATSPFAGTGAGDLAHQGLMSKASEYDNTVTTMLVGGVFMVIVGGIMTCTGSKRKQK